MIQITGLTRVYRKGSPPAVLDLTFDARPGMVTVLLGDEGAGKSTALRLMLELERGQGITLFNGRPYRRIRRPEREVGVLLPGPGEGAAAVAGHPGRKASGHLRMLAAAVGVPARRADELLEQTRLAAVAGRRLRIFSPGMHRRLALAAALLGDPGTLLLDAPTEGLSPRNVEWFHSFLRSFAVAGGTVLVTTRTPQEAARLADRVVTLDRGRLVADQPVSEFCRTRLSPEVAVRGPQMARLADLLVSHGAEVRRDGGAGLAVAGIERTEIGELAYRHGILLHELADRVVEQLAPRAALPAPSGRSGRLRLRQTAEPAPEAEPSPEPSADRHPEPHPDPHAESHSDPHPDPHAESHSDPHPEPTHHPEVAEPATRGRSRDDASLPTRALPVAAVTAALPTLGAVAADRADPAPTVALDRLVRDQPAPAPDPARASTAAPTNATARASTAVPANATARASTAAPANATARASTAVPANATARASTAVPANATAQASTTAPTGTTAWSDDSARIEAQPSRRRQSAADLLTDDTVRLGRLTTGKAPTTPDDHRSE
ncbi:ATP-binding cassette domain-containing protein [Kitasatospora sp. NPDC058190]|uniref:ATP-binding cassette domain-containing protein n=1 Tax=Kitasatospora sp. NPDC058190 TaxID=3346371 RepID=UPI0036D7754F